MRRVIEMIHALAASARDPKWGFSGPYMALSTPSRRRSSGTDLAAVDPVPPANASEPHPSYAPLHYSPPPSVKPACAKGGRIVGASES